MIPKVNKFEFYIESSSERGLVQLIGEANEKFTPPFLSPEEISKIEERVKLCTALTIVEFRIDSYGLVNFFIEQDDLIGYFKLLPDLLLEFEDFDSIEYVKNSLEFYEENKTEILKLRSYPEDYEERVKVLTEKINFKETLYNSTVLLAEEIAKRPSDFCFDENGAPINPQYSGRLKDYYKTSGVLKSDFRFLNGKADGECFSYDLGGNKIRMDLYENGKKLKNLQQWNNQRKEIVFPTIKKFNLKEEDISRGTVVRLFCNHCGFETYNFKIVGDSQIQNFMGVVGITNRDEKEIFITHLTKSEFQNHRTIDAETIANRIGELVRRPNLIYFKKKADENNRLYIECPDCETKLIEEDERSLGLFVAEGGKVYTIGVYPLL